MKTLPFLLLLCCGLAAPLRAENTRPPVHTVEFPQGDAVWSVTVEPSGEKGPRRKASTEPRQEKIDIVRQGALRRDTVTWPGGKTTEVWWLAEPPVAIAESERNGAINVVSAAELLPLRLDAKAFAWIGDTTFQGNKRFKGRRCQCYETKEEALPGQRIRAWIDAKTRQPVAIDNGIGLFIFQLHPTETPEALTLPARFQKALARYQSFRAPSQKP